MIAAAVVVSALLSLGARTGTGNPAEIFRDKDPQNDLVIHGQLRLRMALFNNLDLDRGPSPTTGAPLFADAPAGAFPVSASDARLRLNPSLFIGDELRVFVDVDVASAALGAPLTGLPYDPKAPQASFNFLDVRAAGVDWLLPVGVLSVGRMPSHFALGIAANDGAAIDDDGGDRADRVALILPVFGHLLAGAFDVLDDPFAHGAGLVAPSSSGLTGASSTPSIGEQAITLGVMKWRAPWEIELYRKAGRPVFDYGAALSYEWESKDGLSVGALLPRDASIVRRDTRLVVGDLWARLVVDRFRFETEAFAGDLEIQNPSPIAGVVVREPIRGNPAAFALVGEMRLLDDADGKARGVLVQLETGAASADPAPGFPVVTPQAFSGSQAGDVFGAQVDLKRGGDARFDAARINPLHRVDLILWRTLLGGISEAAYGRARVEGSPVDGVRLDANLVYSQALSPDSAPGGAGPLGVELDVGAEATLDNASIRVDAGNLVPLGGLGVRGGSPTGLSSWAQVILVRVAYAL